MREHFTESSRTKKTIVSGLFLTTLMTSTGCDFDLSKQSSPTTSIDAESPFIPESRVHLIEQGLAADMKDVTLRDYPGCATVDTLRIVEVPYRNFNNQNIMGSLVVREALAEE
ncbi:MAG TPA: hypothetical protein VFT59_01995, partial [Candidatus Saccharimonadales bacterium]|nr:hypothetical protein [Candidatus Saccharimonadales bacterium]